jgi:hypothetical protein
MWSSCGSGSLSFVRHMQCGHACQKSCGPAAAKLARRDGITATARVLGVDRPSLQKWTDRLEPRASTKPPKSRGRRRLDGSAAPAFVELLTASTGTATSCVVEVESVSGGKPRLDLKTIATRQLAELIRAFAAS